MGDTFAEQLRKLESESAERIWNKLLDIEARVLQPPGPPGAMSANLSEEDESEERERRVYVPPRTRNGLRGEAPCTAEDLDEWRPLIARVLENEAKMEVSNNAASGGNAFKSASN